MFGNKSQFAFSGSTTRRVFLFIAIASPLLFCLYWVVGVLTESDMFFRSLHNDAIGYSSVRPMDINADLTSELPKESPSNAAYVFLALGPQALQMNCPAAIESLSRIGGWTGDVYLISDRLDCFDKDEIVRNAEMKEDKLHIVSVDDDFSSGGYDFKHKDIGLRQVRVKSFAMKTKLFNYVDENIEKIAYVDCDVLFSIPGCANDFAQSQDNHWKDSPFGFTRVKYGNISADGSASIISDIPEPIHYMPTTFTAPPGNNVLADLHAGSFVAHRHHSKEGLRIWRERLEKLIEHADNDGYIAAYYEQQALNPNVVNPLTPREVLYRGSEVRYELFATDNPEKACFVHVSKARCSLYGREAIQRFVNRYNLNTYKKTYPYCTHPLLYPLLYGFIPISAFPGCPKFEQLL